MIVAIHQGSVSTMNNPILKKVLMSQHGSAGKLPIRLTNMEREVRRKIDWWITVCLAIVTSSLKQPI